MKRRHDSYWPDDAAPAAWARVHALARWAGQGARRISAVELGLIVALFAVIAVAVAGTLNQAEQSDPATADPVFAPVEAAPGGLAFDVVQYTRLIFRKSQE